MVEWNRVIFIVDYALNTWSTSLSAGSLNRSHEQWALNVLEKKYRIEYRVSSTRINIDKQYYFGASSTFFINNELFITQRLNQIFIAKLIGFFFFEMNESIEHIAVISSKCEKKPNSQGHVIEEETSYIV